MAFGPRYDLLAGALGLTLAVGGVLFALLYGVGTVLRRPALVGGRVE